MLKKLAKKTINDLSALKHARIEQLISDNTDLEIEDELVESITSLIYTIEEEYLDEDLLELTAMEELRRVVESQNWYMEEYDSFFEFSQISPAGEDFNFSINKNDGNVMTTHDLVKEVKRVYNNFDPEEHVENWIRAKHQGITGIPGILILVEDSKKIENMLYELKEALEREFLW